MPVFQIIPTLGSRAGSGGGGGASITYPWTSGIKAIGDSITVPTGAASSWFDRVNTGKGVSGGTKWASAGQGMSYGITTLFSNMPLTQSVPLACFIGFNDTRVLSGSETLRYEHVKAAHRALVAMQFAASVEMCYSGNSNMAFSSGASDASSSFITSWRSRAQWFISNGTPGASFFLRTSSILNETITFSITGDNVVIGTWGFSSAHPATKFTVTIDGVLALTYDPMNRTDEAIAQDINDAIVITGLSNTTHTVVIKAIESGKLFGIDWVGKLKSIASCATIPVFILDMPHMTSTGYSTSGFVTDQTILDGCSAARKTDLQSVFAGYPIAFVDINQTGYYLPNGTNTNTDGVHPTDTGQQLIANRVIYYTT
jgi:hypothetical protein